MVYFLGRLWKEEEKNCGDRLNAQMNEIGDHNVNEIDNISFCFGPFAIEKSFLKTNKDYSGKINGNEIRQEPVSSPNGKIAFKLVDFCCVMPPDASVGSDSTHIHVARLRLAL